MQLKVWAQTDVGRKRDSNQDTFLIDEDLKLFIVADGMGGHKGGEVASAIAVETVQEIVSQAHAQEPGTNPRDLLLRAYSRASERIYERSFENDGELQGMGTTMVLVYVVGSHLYIGNVGDSRCYLFFKDMLWQVSEDHSLVSEQLRAGILREEEVKTQLPKNVITRSVGYEREVSPDFFERELTPGESFLLCSDGLSGPVSDQGIADILRTEKDENVPQKCIDAANAGGGEDNITAMYVKVC